VDKKEGCEPFDLARSSVARPYSQARGTTALAGFKTAHHIVIDGRSIDIILEELGTIYSAECQGIFCELSHDAIQEYIKWQEQQSQGEKMAVDESIG
jgi:hypothetical protein